MTRRVVTLSLVLAVAAAAAATVSAQSAYLPQRVFHTASRSMVDFEGMLADLTQADVVFVGEQHDDPNTHRIELAILEGAARRRPDVIVSLEMFERDVQESLGHFLQGHLTETDFLANARPWPRYATDYKPLVDFAMSREWPVVAANVPRPMASEISKAGIGVLDGKTGDDRRWFARDLQCPTDDDYFGRFQQAMGGHPADDTSENAVAEQRLMTERFYQAQCVKDETMAEAIAAAWTEAATGDARPLVVHFNGAFHSDFALGTASRTERRLPGRRVVVVTVVPVESLDRIAPEDEDLRRADYLIYTIKKS
jgi:uncharacterized iron-regulated protein